MVEVMETVPDALQSKRTEITSHLGDRIATTNVRAIAAVSFYSPNPTLTNTMNDLISQYQGILVNNQCFTYISMDWPVYLY
jgi:hypothetical protein